MLMLSKPQQTLLLTTAWHSIARGVKVGKPLILNLSDYPTALLEPQASFVTLSYQSQMRGCIGHLKAVRPLVEDVSENAFAAAFCDQHHSPITEAELAELDITIDIVSPTEALTFNSELDLISQLQAGIDGLILEDGARHASFLPTTWTTLQTPMQFVQQLKQKAGLPATYWSKSIKISRFTTQQIS